MSSLESNTNQLAEVAEQLRLGELSISLEHARKAARILQATCVETNHDNRDGIHGLHVVLEEAITHGENVTRCRNIARTELGMYILNVQTGTGPGAPAASHERALVRARRRPAPGAELTIRPERVVHLSPVMGEERNLVWARVNDTLVPLVESFDDRAYQGYVDNWRQFRDAGLPVPPMYLRSGSGTLLIPEVKEDGSELYGTGIAWNLYNRLPRDRPRPEADVRFIELTGPENLHVIERRLHELVRIANDHSLQLPHHDPFQLHVHPDGTWDLVMRDLRTSKDIARHPYYRTKRELRVRNEQSAAMWLVRIRVLRQYLHGEPPGLSEEQLAALFATEAR